MGRDGLLVGRDAWPHVSVRFDDNSFIDSAQWMWNQAARQRKDE
jgi:hypothetical protein